MPTKKAATAPGVMDVTHPSKVKPTASGVPIIITNRPIMKDPMMVDGTPKSSDSSAEKAPSSKKLELKPLSTEELKPVVAQGPQESGVQGAPVLPIAELEKVGSKKQADTLEASEVPEPDAPKEPNADASLTDEKPEIAEEAKAPITQENDKGIAQTTEVGTKAPEVPAEDAGDDELLPAERPADAKAAKEAREAAEKQLALEKLIAEGTYVLPVNAVEKRRLHETILVVTLVVLVLGIAGFLLALDAGYVHIAGFPAPTNFIKG